MNQFTADVAGILEIAVIAAGLITLYFANKERSGLLRIAAGVMIIGGIAVGACTTYWWLKYYNKGSFDAVISYEDCFPKPDDNGPLHHYHPADWNGPTDGNERDKGK